MDKLITILTPIYNRANVINNLYNSLLSQTSYNFEWLIIDDGSTDDLESKVKSFSTIKFDIHYIKKENGGKHIAINVGIDEIKSKLTFIVDSDDILEKNAIERIEFYYSIYKTDISLCGFSFLRKYPDGKINGKKFKNNELIGSYYEIRVKGNDTNSDKAEVYFTDILKKYPFPEFENEKFLGEDIVWMQIAKKFNMIHINEAIYIGDYQTDGLTKNRITNNIKSPRGCYERAKIFLQFRLPFKLKIKNIVQLYIYGGYAHIPFIERLNVSNHKFMFLLLVIPSFFYKKLFLKKGGN